MKHRMAATGAKSSAATAMSCNSGYISRILTGQANLSLEQADKLNQHLSHNDDESHFFLLLVQLEKAGTESLKSYFQKQLNRIKTEISDISSFIDDTQYISEEHQTKYYSKWFHAAIHALLTIPKFQTTTSISDYLNLPETTISKALGFLVATGIAVQKEGRYFIGAKRIHLNKGSNNYRLAFLRFRFLMQHNQFETKNKELVNPTVALKVDAKLLISL